MSWLGSFSRVASCRLRERDGGYAATANRDTGPSGRHWRAIPPPELSAGTGEPVNPAWHHRRERVYSPGRTSSRDPPADSCNLHGRRANVPSKKRGGDG